EIQDGHQAKLLRLELLIGETNAAKQAPLVTEVDTCALTILTCFTGPCVAGSTVMSGSTATRTEFGAGVGGSVMLQLCFSRHRRRSEERRVGKECRSYRSAFY